jgi:hypothetical protein
MEKRCILDSCCELFPCPPQTNLTDFTCQTDKQRNTKEWKKQQQKETAEFSRKLRKRCKEAKIWGTAPRYRAIVHIQHSPLR